MGVFSLSGKRRPAYRSAARRGKLAVLLLALAAPALGQGDDNGLPRRFFDTRRAPAFGDATEPLRVYLRAEHRGGAAPQHFCVVGYEASGPGASRFAEVHWREGRQLILWDGAGDPVSRRDALRFSRRPLDLRRDVVATDAAVGGSTYLVTRAWVAQVLADCARRGTRYAVRA